MNDLSARMAAAGFAAAGAEHAEWSRTIGKSPLTAILDIGGTPPLLPNWSDVRRIATQKALEMAEIMAKKEKEQQLQDERPTAPGE